MESLSLSLTSTNAHIIMLKRIYHYVHYYMRKVACVYQRNACLLFHPAPNTKTNIKMWKHSHEQMSNGDTRTQCHGNTNSQSKHTTTNNNMHTNVYWQTYTNFPQRHKETRSQKQVTSKHTVRTQNKKSKEQGINKRKPHHTHNMYVERAIGTCWSS